MADAYGMIKVLVRKQYGGPISVVVNMAQSMTDGKKAYRRIAEVSRRFLGTDLYFAGVLLRDDRVRAAVRARTPVVLAFPKARISASFAALAARLGGAEYGSPNRDSFFRKVVQWFN
jgi:flagellar biosynthesis protein FlhG